MSIVYSCIAEGGRIYNQAGDRSAIAKWNPSILGLLQRVQPVTRKSYEYNGCSINYIAEAERVYLAVADKQMNTRIVFAFLEKIADNYASMNGSSFDSTLSEQMAIYSRAQNNDRMLAIQQEISQVKEIMMENISSTLKRGERLEDLVDKTDNLVIESNAFRENSNQLKKAMWWKNVKLWILIIIILIVCVAMLKIYIYMYRSLDRFLKN